MTDVLCEDHPQVNESWMLKDEGMRKLFMLRVVLLAFLSTVWWFQVYFDGNIDFTYLLTNFIYLTHVGLNLAVMYMFLAVIDMMSVAHNWSFKLSSPTSWVWKLEHFLFRAAFSVSLAILLLFWVGVYPSVSTKEKNDKWRMVNLVLQHGGVFAAISIEFWVNNISLKWKHFYALGSLFGVYLFANAIFTFTNKPVYRVMNWKSVQSYAFTLGGVILTILYFALGKFIYEKYKLKHIPQ